MAIWLDDRYMILSQVRAASGVKYQEGDTEFWIKGDEASYREPDPDGSTLSCTLVKES